MLELATTSDKPKILSRRMLESEELGFKLFSTSEKPLRQHNLKSPGQNAEEPHQHD